MTKEEIIKQEEREYTQIKESIVKLLKKNSESGFTYKQIKNKFLLFPAQAYYLLLDLVEEEKIEREGKYYFIKRQQ
ncbi:MAG: hypothetical protein U9P70_03640 [Patescibacteria group bacterium]|nr:hypothetical protein [Patescibacteria group bacterium]